MMLTLLLINLFTFVELNCENLFDYMHDIGKEDTEFTPDGSYHWTKSRYWKKLDRTGQTILSCADSASLSIPDMAVLCEVENDTVLHDLTCRSLLRGARYEYVMTGSPDRRGIDVALLYSPFTFRLLSSHAVRVDTIKGMRPTRDLLYAKGVVASGDTLHVIAAHFPSRRGGEKASRPYRWQAARQLGAMVDSIYNKVAHDAMIIVAGDFNMYSGEKTMDAMLFHGLVDLSANARGRHGAKGTYRYQGAWGSLDHILVSPAVIKKTRGCHINDASFLTEPDEKYGGTKPRRNFLGPVYRNGFSDHLPLVATFAF